MNETTIRRTDDESAALLHKSRLASAYLAGVTDPLSRVIGEAWLTGVAFAMAWAHGEDEELLDAMKRILPLAESRAGAKHECARKETP